MLRVHLVREPEPEQRALLVEALIGTAIVAFGPVIDPKTDVLVEGQLKPEHLAACPDVRHVIVPFAGLIPPTRDQLLLHPHLKVHNLHHNAAMTAEMAMALLLACARRVVSLHNSFAQDDWEPRYFSRDAATLCGKTVVVLGFGEIGRRVGRACEGFGMNVVGVRTEADCTARGVDELHDLLPSADYLVVTLPLTDATEGLIGVAELALLPRHAIVVNVGRGRVIDEAALFKALESQSIDSAGLDVWWLYPKSPEDKTPPSNFPFASLPNVVMTPHVAGATRDAEPLRIAELVRVVKAIAAGDEDCNRIDVARGY
jgi:phosphoglycerate dehydrogenase-like enzyme